MIEKKFIKSGNSWCISIPASVIKILGINPEKDKVQISLQNDNIITIKPIIEKDSK